MLHTGLTYGIVYRRNKTNKTTAGQDKSKQNRTLDWRRSARRQALSSASAPLSTPRCHMPTFFAAVMMLTHRVSLSRKIFHVCVFCVFFPSILDIKFVGRTSRGHTGGRSHRIFNPPSFCGACIDFCREKDSAIPFPRRP